MEAGSQEQPLVPGGTGTLVAQPVEPAAFPPFDSTTFASQLLWLAITFGVLYYLMAKVALPRIAGILKNRRDRIASDLDMADRLKTDSEAALAGYETALAEARANAFAIAEAARDKAKTAAAVQRAEIAADLNKKLATAEARIAAIKSLALSEVGAIAGEATEAIVKRLIGADVVRGEIDDAVSASMAK